MAPYTIFSAVVFLPSFMMMRMMWAISSELYFGSKETRFSIFFARLDMA